MIELPTGTRGLVFDCDGTLADTMPIHLHLWDILLREQGLIVPESFIEDHAGKPTEVIAQLINEQYNASIDPVTFFEEKERRFQEEWLEKVGPIEPVVATARHYRGELPMAVVSGGCRKNVTLSLEAIGILDWFPVILTADDPIPHKPAPDLFLIAAEKIGIPPEACHAFEDADAGIEAARRAGMTVTDVREVMAALTGKE